MTTKQISEDIRTILNKLDEYITIMNEKESDETASDEKASDEKASDEKASDETLPDPGKEDVDDLLTNPFGFKPIDSKINSQSLAKLLDIPKEVVGHFRTAIQTLKQDDPSLNRQQITALAVAFNQALIGHKLAHSPGVPSDDVKEELNQQKLNSYMQKSAAHANKPNDSISHMKSMIDAVQKHGTPDEKKDLGLD